MDEEVKQNFWQKMTKGEKILAIVLAVGFLFVFYIALDANKYQATVHVIAGEGKVGVNPTTERLDFGDLSPGTSAIRSVDIENWTTISMYVAIVNFGSINALMEIKNAQISEVYFKYSDLCCDCGGDRLWFTVLLNEKTRHELSHRGDNFGLDVASSAYRGSGFDPENREGGYQSRGHNSLAERERPACRQAGLHNPQSYKIKRENARDERGRQFYGGRASPIRRRAWAHAYAREGPSADSIYGIYISLGGASAHELRIMNHEL